jgi:RNA polymerase sigma factor (sigma-70 family)
MEDSELLRSYLVNHSEAAFGALVAKHVDLVYSAALRQTRGDHHRAKEATQMVFIGLAKKASALVEHPALEAWLYRSTRLAAADSFRREMRRREHENASAIDSAVTPDDSETLHWEALRPLLDDAMSQLSERDREAIVMRYFANHPFVEVGRRLGLSENAARMRVERALEKLRGKLFVKGIRSKGAALAAILSAEAIVAAPAGVATATTAAVIAGAASASTGILLFMTTNKMAVAALAVIVAAGTGVVVHQERSNERLAREIAGLQAQTGDFASILNDNHSLNRSADEVRSLKTAAGIGAAAFSTERELKKRVAGLQNDLVARRTSPNTGNARAAAALDFSALDTLPAATFQARPAYPPDMRVQGVSGQVLVDLVVDNQGNVQSAVPASSTRPEFEQSAVDAVSLWTFNPATKGGEAVSTHMQIPIVYVLNVDAPSAPGAGSADAFTVQVPPQAAVQAPRFPATPASWFPTTKG